MLEYFNIDNNTLFFIVVVLVAIVSIGAFLLPFMRKQERSKKFREIIEKRRKTLKESEKAKEVIDDGVSAKASLAKRFWVEKMGGEMAEQYKSVMLQAGIRDQRAPIYLIIAQICGPFVMVGIALFMIKVAGYSMGGFLDFLAMLVSTYAGFKLPVMIIESRAKERQMEINLAFPDALDVMLICVQGGIGLEQSIQRVSEEMSEYSPILAEEMGILSAEMAVLNDRRDALQSFASRLGSGAARSFSTSLIQAEQYGTSIGQALRVMADDLRDQRMSEAERKAAALPPKLTVPMILFFLPALFIVIGGPAAIQVSAMQ